MIIWSGLGIFVPIIALVQFFILGYFNLLTSSNWIFSSLYFFPLSFVFWILGRKLNSPGFKLFSRQGFRFQGRHSFFFLRIEVWSITALILGIAAIIKTFFQ